MESRGWVSGWSHGEDGQRRRPGPAHWALERREMRKALEKRISGRQRGMGKDLEFEMCWAWPRSKMGSVWLEQRKVGSRVGWGLCWPESSQRVLPGESNSHPEWVEGGGEYREAADKGSKDSTLNLVSDSLSWIWLSQCISRGSDCHALGVYWWRNSMGLDEKRHFQTYNPCLPLQTWHWLLTQEV